MASPSSIPALNPDAPDVAWRPPPDYVERSRLRRFMRTVGVDSYHELLAWAAADPARFWDAAVRDLELEFYQQYAATLDLSRGVPWARWFEGGLYNYAHDAVDKRASGAAGGKVAVVWEGEEGATRTLTYAELYAASNRLASALQGLGIEQGARVGVFLPMIPETVAAMLALAKLGAIVIPIFSGYAAPAVAARLADCEATLLITADGFFRRGKPVEMKRVADEAVAAVPGLQHVIVVRRAGIDVPWTEGRDLWWHELVAAGSPAFETRHTTPEDPYMILYTSGTTGRPKGAVHVHGGFPIKGAQDLAHCFDVQADDVLFWLTDLGWMMGPWAISGTLMLGATLLLYDGTPDYPGPDRLWALAARHGITVLGIAPTAVRALKTHGAAPVRAHDLGRLRVLGSTGEPWDPESWRWLFETAGRGRCPIINYSGGTEISGGIVGCTTITPLKPCCFAGPVPGMDVDVVDEMGHSVRGAVGELVIRGPWPGMTRGFWKDPDRYLETYWSRLPGTWVHGDWAEIDADGFWYIRGRSDDTIKVAGKRIGPAEVEAAALAHPAVAAAAAVGVPHAIKGEAVVVFAVLRPGLEEGEALRAEIAEAIVRALGKALKPEAVRFVGDLPRTRNAKILRRVIRARYLGRPLGDLTSLENPAAVEEIAHAR
jgi:acetyl-CoA synthetase